MAKFLTYEDRLEIERGLKEHITFTEIGKKLECLHSNLAPPANVRNSQSVTQLQNKIPV
ncbi:MAG: helix-turn-helix domain-containing protein [Lachnospiraceae bacterium]